MLGRLFDASRNAKRAISLIYDSLAVGVSLFSALCLRLGTFEPPLGRPEVLTLTVTLVISIVAFARLGLYRAILRFMAHQALVSVLIGVCISAAVLVASSFYFQASMPRSVPIIYLFTASFFIGAPRLIVRSIVQLLSREPIKDRENVIIYGAGQSGFQLAAALQGTQYKVTAFVDDNRKLARTLVRGLCVYKPKDLSSLIKSHKIRIVLLALGNAPRSQRAQIINRLEPLGLTIKTIPRIKDILSGKSKIEDIKDIDVEDLLGRDPVKPDSSLMDACIKGRNVLVTGAGGSIGSELCRQIIKHGPLRLILFELNEYNLYKIEHELAIELSKLSYHVELVSLIGSVVDTNRLSAIFSEFSIHTIYHAAAYKHVPLIEHNVLEGVRNNIFGTWNCAEAAISSKVESFVLVSTDKAVRPTNVMGASKRLAELILQALAKRQNNTRFTMVRFGNVLGSSGSVVPLFRKQIRQGGPVTVTHPEITRYFMTIPEAAELVIQAGSMGKGGDVFVLDMGEPVKIVELALRMIHLCGLTCRDDENPEGDIEIHFTGLRPGEKLYEELLVGKNVSGTQHLRIMRALEYSISWEEMEAYLNGLKGACEQDRVQDIINILVSAPTEFKPSISTNHYDYKTVAINQPSLKLVKTKPIK